MFEHISLTLTCFDVCLIPMNSSSDEVIRRIMIAYEYESRGSYIEFNDYNFNNE